MGATQNKFARKQTDQTPKFQELQQIRSKCDETRNVGSQDQQKAIPKILCKEIKYKMLIKKTQIETDDKPDEEQNAMQQNEEQYLMIKY